MYIEEESCEINLNFTYSYFIESQGSMEPEAGLNTQIAPFFKYNLNCFKYFENTLHKEKCSFLRRSMERQTG